jgi:hypothetical protein
MAAKAKATSTSTTASKAKSSEQTPRKNSATTEVLAKKAPVKRKPARPTSIKPTSSEKDATKTFPAQSTLGEEGSTKKPPVTRIRDTRVYPPTGIWTTATSQTFYGSVNALSNKLGDRQSPQIPKNYRIKETRDFRERGEYTLSYEEELHLADHFAFLAHATEGVEFVSAATIEELHDPPGFNVRLASNHTPTEYVRDGLGKILEIVRDHAHEGKIERDTVLLRLLRSFKVDTGTHTRPSSLTRLSSSVRKGSTLGCVAPNGTNLTTCPDRIPHRFPHRLENIY